jgi:hypothetical protein
MILYRDAYNVPKDICYANHVYGNIYHLQRYMHAVLYRETVTLSEKLNIIVQN